ncbi:integral membrane protein [Colletotrichum musicola]|uniref:Integral membrane protein n=1 Tax=Colletotrichum musicola TaxID=2175873 RepID=A0A8H6N9H0_9PEZI|nr:integral membrane protein [Colletotrichum musicola]
MLRGMQEMQMMNAMHAGMMSVTYQGIEGMRVVSGTTDGYEHGSAALGWHATDEGATAAAFRNEMSSGMSQANSASTWMRMAQLTTEWKEVE